MDFTEKIISRDYVYQGAFIKVESILVELPDGNNSNRDVIRHPGAVAIIALLDNDTMLLVRQFRMSLNKTLLEIPAGKIEKNEEHIISAHRELEEETGYKCNKMEYIGTIATSAGFSDQLVHIYKATELYQGIKGGDEDEFIEVEPHKISDVKSLIKEGKIIDAKTIASLMYL